MRLRGWAWLAFSSSLLSPLQGAVRPRYGGTLTVELSPAFAALNPSEVLPDATAQSKREDVLPLVVETLVCLDEKGGIAPKLAVAWQHDAERRHWRFSLRAKATFHDGEALTAAAAAPSLSAALKKKYSDVTLTAGGQTLVIRSSNPMTDLLTELARPRAAVFRSSEKVPLIGTGPFRIAAWEPNRRLTLAAFEEYWGARPFLDSVIVNLGATRALGDVFDIPFSQMRRVVPERTKIWLSPTRELIALVADRVPPAAWQALALAMDRAPIVNVLTQKRGEAAFSLLPEWLSGYAFLFTAAPDLPRAKQLVSQARIAPLTLGYPASDLFLRSVAERIALNARDAGIILQPVQSGGANVRLVRQPLELADPAAELPRLAEMLGIAERASALDSAKPETLYQAERALLDAHRVIPIAYLPEVYGIAPRVHNWEASQKNGGFALHLEDIWVEP